MWKDLARRLDVIGAEETELRRQLNFRWLIASIDDVRRDIHHAAVTSRLRPLKSNAKKREGRKGEEEESRRRQQRQRHGSMTFVAVASNGTELQTAMESIKLRLSLTDGPVDATINLCANSIHLSRTLDVFGPNLTLTLQPARLSSELCALDEFADPAERRRTPRLKLSYISDLMRVTLDAHRSFRAIRVREGARLIIRAGITVRNGRISGTTFDSGHGAGILVEGLNTQVEAREGLLITNNDAERYGGGGMHVANGAKVHLADSTFIRNFAASYGGAVSLSGWRSSLGPGVGTELGSGVVGAGVGWPVGSGVG